MVLLANFLCKALQGERLGRWSECSVEEQHMHRVVCPGRVSRIVDDLRRRVPVRSRVHLQYRNQTATVLHHQWYMYMCKHIHIRTCQLNSPFGPMLVTRPLLSTNTLSYTGPWGWERGEADSPAFPLFELASQRTHDSPDPLRCSWNGMVWYTLQTGGMYKAYTTWT